MNNVICFSFHWPDSYFLFPRFVCLSDTHARTDRMTHDVPYGDVLIHAGDFTNVGKIKDVLHFKNFLGIK